MRLFSNLCTMFDQCYVAVDGVVLPGGTEIVVARLPNRVVTYHYHDMCGSTSCIYFARKCGGTKNSARSVLK